MARDLFGNKKVRREDKYTKRSNSGSTEWDVTNEKLKIVLYLFLGYIYFHFIIMGWTL